jgi:hypothetical protein
VDFYFGEEQLAQAKGMLFYLPTKRKSPRKGLQDESEV